MTLFTYDNAPDVFRALSEQLAAQAQSLRVPLNLALSGGTTAVDMFRYWVAHYRDKIDWNNIRFYWVDERCVPPTDDQSNFKHAHEELFRPLAIPETHIHRMRGEAPPAQEAVRYGELLRQRLPEHLGEPRLDAAILGIGEDGHTASLFPGQTTLLSDPAPCAVGRHAKSGQQRITLSGTMLLRASCLYVPVTGAGKRPVLERLLGNPPQNAVIDTGLPSGYILSHARNAFLYTDSVGIPIPGEE